MAERGILVVDDDVDTCSNTSDILGDLAYEVDVAYRGWDAIKLAEQKKYRLALLDYRLPCMTGVDLYCHLKRLLPSTQGVLVTAFANEEAVERASEAGMRRVLPKPVDFGEWISLVQGIVG